VKEAGVRTRHAYRTLSSPPYNVKNLKNRKILIFLFHNITTTKRYFESLFIFIFIYCKADKKGKKRDYLCEFGMSPHKLMIGANTNFLFLPSFSFFTFF
jgi:hypothetical protein